MPVLDHVPVQADDLAARTIAGEAVVVTPTSAQVHELDPVATFVFERCDGRRTGWGLVDELVAEFAVDRDVAAADLEVLLGTFVARGLVVLRSVEG